MTVADVVERLRAILAPLDRGDGVACFTRLYLTVTETVQAQLASTFADPPFLADLDGRFAELFFAAVAATGSRRSPAWQPLFEARGRAGVAPIQFALAGMNAHINGDLPVALVASCRHAGISLAEGSPQHADYERVNNVLATVERQIKEQYLGGWLHTVDGIVHRVHRLDDAIAMWDVRAARDAAWTNAQALWALRESPPLYERYLATLQRTVGLAGRGLLVPSDTLLARLGRLVR